MPAPEGLVGPVPPVRVQVVSLVLKPLPVKLILASPWLPLVGLNANAGAPVTRGVATNEIETKSAEVSNNTMNRELELRVVNLETHGIDVVGQRYLMLHILAIWAVSTK